MKILCVLIAHKEYTSMVAALIAYHAPPSQGVPKHVMDSAKRAIKKYRADLEYLRDR